jgi:hypothetical protein
MLLREIEEPFWRRFAFTIQAQLATFKAFAASHECAAEGTLKKVQRRKEDHGRFGSLGS